jgi:hypothetical protein
VSGRPKRFSVASGLPPSAEEAVAVTTPGRHDVTASPARAHASENRIAFTWRMTAERKHALDRMAIEISEQLGRARLGRAEILDALADLAMDNPGVRGALIARLQENQTS